MSLRPKAWPLVAAVLSATVPPLILAFKLKAEGPLWLVILASSIMVFAAWYALNSDSAIDHWTRWLKRIALSLAGFLAIAAVLVILVQLNVTRRSLAEAWLDLARVGEAFGFFSFFAVEIFALLCAMASWFWIVNRTAAAVVGLGASITFALGLIYGQWPCLALSGLAGLALPFLAIKDGQLWQRLRAAWPVLVVSLAASALVTCLFGKQSDNPLLRPFDLSALVVKLAPSFPLLLEVPGYGYDIGVGRPSSALYLSEAVLFYAEGPSQSLHYLVSAVYEDWSGTHWRPAAADDPAISIERTQLPEIRPYNSLRLRLAEDFFSLFPLERSTVLIRLAPESPNTVAGINSALRFGTTARRGQIVDFQLGTAPLAETPPDISRLSYVGEAFSAEFWALAKSLSAEPAGETPTVDSAYRTVRRILDYLASGFVYSLNAISPDSPKLIERFLFQEPKGYCVHFATALALLARAAGLPARLVEGFRLSLDEQGRGIISGQHSHAWVELWIDDAWRPFEATPPFMAEDPWAYWDGQDRAALRQLEALWGLRDDDGPRANLVLTWRPSFSLVSLLTVLAISLSLILICRRDPASRLRRRAAALVRRFRAIGIAGPERLGWTGWSAAVIAWRHNLELSTKAPSKHRLTWLRFWQPDVTVEEIQALSEALMNLAFGPPSD